MPPSAASLPCAWVAAATTSVCLALLLPRAFLGSPPPSPVCSSRAPTSTPQKTSRGTVVLRRDLRGGPSSRPARGFSPVPLHVRPTPLLQQHWIMKATVGLLGGGRRLLHAAHLVGGVRHCYAVARPTLCRAVRAAPVSEPNASGTPVLPDVAAIASMAIEAYTSPSDYFLQRNRGTQITYLDE